MTFTIAMGGAGGNGGSNGFTNAPNGVAGASANIQLFPAAAEAPGRVALRRDERTTR